LAGIVSKNIDKAGNTIWAACPSCHGWLPVAPDLLAAGIDLHCPICQLEFPSGEAGRILLPEDMNEPR